MKKNLLAIVAVAFAIAFSAFTTKPFGTDMYLTYTSGIQKDVNHYTQSVNNPGAKAGVDVLAWIKIPNDADAFITSGEFNSAFEVLDQVATTSNSLDDDTEGNVTVSGLVYRLEKQDAP
jgi:hypothetical protein